MAADTVATLVLQEDDVNYMAKFTNMSQDGVGESAVKKVDVSALSPVAYLVSIDEITWTCHGMGVQILWDADTDVLAWTLPINTSGHLKFKDLPGSLINTKATGYTGDILFTTVGHHAGDSYSITLKCTKTK